MIVKRQEFIKRILTKLNRRRFLTYSGATLLSGCTPLSNPAETSRSWTAAGLNIGLRIGEVTASSAIAQFRTSVPVRGITGPVVTGQSQRVRLRIQAENSTTPDIITGWQTTEAENDFYTQFVLDGLNPGTVYGLSLEREDKNIPKPPVRYFKTASSKENNTAVLLAMTTCQHTSGEPTMRALQASAPDAVIFSGDNVYYDGMEYDWYARNVPECFEAYQKIFGLPAYRDIVSSLPTYFMKDDHDYRFDDAGPKSRGAWIPESRIEPGRSIITDRYEDENGAFVFDEGWIDHENGVRIFNTVYPSSDLPYRRFRRGKAVEFWLLEVREFRSPNDMPDGPDKTIWGPEQKAWLMEGLATSDAALKCVVSPTPMVGLDKDYKNDSHANKNGFMTEGRAFLDWLIETGLAKNTVILSGDRHWQYHAIYKGQIHELCCGAAAPDLVLDPIVMSAKDVTQPFFRSGAGWLEVVWQPTEGANIRLLDANGKPVYELPISRPS